MELEPGIVALVAAVLPLLLAVVNRPQWPSEVKSLLAFGVCVVVGIIVAWATDHWNRDGIILNIGAVFALTNAAYQAVWKPTKVAPTIEEKTSGI